MNDADADAVDVDADVAWKLAQIVVEEYAVFVVVAAAVADDGEDCDAVYGTITRSSPVQISAQQPRLSIAFCPMIKTLKTNNKRLVSFLLLSFTAIC